MHRETYARRILWRTLFLSIPAIGAAAFVADDLFHLGILEGNTPLHWAGLLDLYTLADGDPQHVLEAKQVGAFPWFFDPQMKMAFFRPLSSALLWVDHELFGLRPHLYVAHSVLWLALLCVLTALVFRDFLTLNRSIACAVIIYTLSGIHWGIWWTATRYSFVSAAIGMGALLCHLRWREAGWRPGLPLSAALWPLALLSGEAALGVVAYLVAYELLAGERPKVRLLAALPATVSTVICLVAYRLAGHGASAGSGYLDPFEVPLQYLLALPGRLLFLVGSMVIGGHTELWMSAPLRPALVVLGAVAVVLAGLVMRRWLRSGDGSEFHRARWLLLGSLLSLLPFTPSILGTRNLIVPFVGIAAMLGLVLSHWWSHTTEYHAPRGRFLNAVCWGLAVVHLVLAPMQRLGAPFLFKTMMHGRLETAMEQAELDEEGLEDRRVVVITSPDLVIGLHSYYYRRLYDLPMPRSWWALSWNPHDQEVRRTDVDTFELTVVDGEMDKPHLRQDQAIVLDGMTARIAAMGKRGPTTVEFEFDRPLEHPSLIFLAWQEGALRRVELPPLGETLLLER